MEKKMLTEKKPIQYYENSLTILKKKTFFS